MSVTIILPIDQGKADLNIIVCLSIIKIIFFSTAALANLCQVNTVAEYAYHKTSVTREEKGSANCTMYPSGLQNNGGSEQYMHCNGKPLRLTDSQVGSEHYISDDYYVWDTQSSSSQLQFIFPTRVNMTTITLHYYSDNVRGHPRLRFYAVPDDFYVWDALTQGNNWSEIAAVVTDQTVQGRRNVSRDFNFMTKRVLLYKFSSSKIFALSEVEFLTCNRKQAKCYIHTPDINHK